MIKIDKYLQQVRLFRIEQQIRRTTFEMALYFDFFGIYNEQIQNVYNTTLDNEEFTQNEKNKIFNESKKMLKEIYNIKI